MDGRYMYLLMIAAYGLVLDIIVLGITLWERKHRKTTSSS
jgi:hypothetical protein